VFHGVRLRRGVTGWGGVGQQMMWTAQSAELPRSCDGHRTQEFSVTRAWIRVTCSAAGVAMAILSLG
jgi:hypothetical protein